MNYYAKNTAYKRQWMKKLITTLPNMLHTHAKIKKVEAKYGVKFKYGKPALSLPEAPNMALQPDALPPSGFAAI
ncbi:MAG: hypothetical protein HC877_17495 [Thioploca sp.]|nr:hypothetical protein [Thioploca sp.]